MRFRATLMVGALLVLATAGSVFGTQPVVKSQDAFGNNSTLGLGASLNLTVNLTTGSGLLQGTTTPDIGTAAGNGSAVFTDLRIDSTGTNKQLTATASGLTNVVSGTFTVNPGAATRLVIQSQPPATATAGTTFSSGTIVRLEDASGNLVTSDNSTVVTATRSSGSARRRPAS